MKQITTSVLFLLVGVFSYAQTAEDVINNYHEVIGGKEKLLEIKSVKSVGKSMQGGMEFPYEALLKDGKMRVDINFQGQDITVQCYDGEQGWTTNFMTMEPEKWAEQDSKLAALQMDMVDPFLRMEENGYTVELVGEEEIEGVPCHKIKLNQGTMNIDGEDVDIESFYFFDKDSGILLASETKGYSGQMKGMVTRSVMSDYQEVDGIYLPFSTTQKMNGQTFSTMITEEMTLNAEIDDSIFALHSSLLDAGNGTENEMKPAERSQGGGN